MKSNSISLCIPAFNAESHLPKLLISAKTQKIPFAEILVYNDCSTDNTAEVAKAHGARVISGESNVGCSAGKNALLRECSSEWIHFHDADDVLLENFTEEAFSWINQINPPDVILMGFEYRDYQTNELISVGLFDDRSLQEDSIKYTILNQIPNFGIYKKKPLLKVGGFEEQPNLLFNEDVALHTKLAINKLRFRASKKITSINFKYKNSMSAANQIKCLRAQHAVMRQVSGQVKTEYFEPICRRLWEIAGGLAAHKDWKEMDRGLELAQSLYSSAPDGQNPQFRKMAAVFSPKVAFRIRECIIRIFKPYLRKP